MPVIVAVDEDVDSLADVERELTDRYSRSYEIVTASSVSDGVARLIEMDSSGRTSRSSSSASRSAPAAGRSCCSGRAPSTPGPSVG